MLVPITQSEASMNDNTPYRNLGRLALLVLALAGVVLINVSAGLPQSAEGCFPDGCYAPQVFSPPIWEFFRAYPVPLAILFMLSCTAALASIRSTGRAAIVMRVSPLLFLLSIGTAALFFYS
jgi:hypothetical protein